MDFLKMIAFAKYPTFTVRLPKALSSRAKWLERRQAEIVKACARYTAAKMAIPMAWLEEYARNAEELGTPAILDLLGDRGHTSAQIA